MMNDRPWLMRTYAGHSSPRTSNALYRANLAKGQNGLSVAFDLPTQTGYDPDDELARGAVGRVGVPIAGLGDMRTLFTGIPLGLTNTSMTINAPAAWLLALYQTVAEEQGHRPAALTGTTQNDIVKEYLARGTYIFPPGPSMRLTTDLIAYTVTDLPRWNPINICSYHLREAGATAVQEIAFALANAIAVLDAVRDSGQVPPSRLPDVVGRVSFFVSAGVRFVEELCKMRAFGVLWDGIARERYGVTDPALRRFRYGVQVNSLGLTETQPENNLQRIVLSMLGVSLSRNARARAIQLPAWNEAMGLPRPCDQQWSLRVQQVLAYESDLLEHGDLFDGSPVIEARVGDLCARARAELDRIESMGGAVAAIEFMRSELVAEHARQRWRLETGEEARVGVNAFTETEPSPLLTGAGAATEPPDPRAEEEAVASVRAWRRARDTGAARRAVDLLRTSAADGANVMPATLACARAGVTTGEWASALREVFGEYHPPGGVPGSHVTAPADGLAALRDAVRRTASELGERPRLLIGKPGLDGHSNGAEQIALRARDAGFEVVYLGIRLTPAQIVAAAVEESVHCVGLSLMSGDYQAPVRQVIGGLRDHGAADVPVVAGGIIPAGTAEELLGLGVAAVFTPKDYTITSIVHDIVGVIRQAHRLPGLAGTQRREVTCETSSKRS
jgi:ethylmalonyl-CoA mutase